MGAGGLRQSLVAAGERLAADVRRRAVLTADQPAELGPILADLGVSRVETGRFIADGRTRRAVDGFEIFLRGDRSPNRRRFTLAHEIGHVAMASCPSSSLEQWIETLRPVSVEQLCDNVAGALLMPRPWLATELTWRSHSVNKLRCPGLVDLLRIGRSAGVSTGAAAVRISAVSSRSYGLIWWSRDSHGWKTGGAAGSPIHVLRQLQLAPGFELADSAGRWTTVHMIDGDSERLASSQVRIYDECTAVMLVGAIAELHPSQSDRNRLAVADERSEAF